METNSTTCLAYRFLTSPSIYPGTDMPSITNTSARKIKKLATIPCICSLILPDGNVIRLFYLFIFCVVVCVCVYWVYIPLIFHKLVKIKLNNVKLFYFQKVVYIPFKWLILINKIKHSNIILKTTTNTLNEITRLA